MPELYKLQNDAKPAQLGGPPFILGSALRVPSTAYDKWGIVDYSDVLEQRSRTVYQDEFVDTSPNWMESVIEAAKRGGIGNRPQMLRDAVAKTAAQLTAQKLRKVSRVNVLDVGCGSGGSLISYLNALEELDPSYVERVYLAGVDLSRANLWKASDTLCEKGIKEGEGCYLYHCRDVDMPAHVDKNGYDIVINVAGIHANAYLDPVFRSINGVLKREGRFVSGDWHHHMWQHPAFVYDMLDQMNPDDFEWIRKGTFMDEFRTKFPYATVPSGLEKLDDADLTAIQDIQRYWRDGWAQVRLGKIREGKLDVRDEQIVLEGHRPVGDYIREAHWNSLLVDNKVVSDGIIDSNPKQLVEGSNLNMLLVLKKK